MNNLENKILDILRSVCGEHGAPLHEPYFMGSEREFLFKCLESTYVSTVGKYVNEFEDGLSEFTGAKYSVAVVNGTAALHIAMLVAGVEKGDEVLIPSLTFIATANAVSYCGAYPHFIDSDEMGLGVCPSALKDWLSHIGEMRSGVLINRKTGRRISAIVPVHIFGHACKMDELLSIAASYGIPLIEDAAESLGTFYKGSHTGTLGNLGIFSFNGNKIITTGGGGAIVTNDYAAAQKVRHLTTTARIKKPIPWLFTHDMVGYNYRMPNLNASLGCAQLESLPDLLALKRVLHKKYELGFKGLADIRLLSEPSGSQSNYWLQALIMEKSAPNVIESLLSITNKNKLGTRPLWGLMHEQVPYMNCPRANLPVAESLVGRVINIPSSAQLGLR